MIFGQFDLGMQEGALTIVRVIASVGGAVVGWFLCDPLTRLVYRISFKGATPGSLVFLGKATGAAALSLAIWFFMPLGGSGTGFGGGTGKGDGNGKGPGKGDGPSAVKDAKPSVDKKPAPPKSAGGLESVEIEIIDEKRYKNDDRFFLVKGAEPALSRAELEDYLKTHQAKIEVTPVRTRMSVQGNINPLADLLELTEQYKIKTLRTRMP